MVKSVRLISVNMFRVMRLVVLVSWISGKNRVSSKIMIVMISVVWVGVLCIEFILVN